MEHESLRSIFEKTENMQFVLSNQEEHQKVSQLCGKLQTLLTSQLEVTAEKSLLQLLTIGAVGLLGGIGAAYLAGPGLLMIGVGTGASEVITSAIAGAGVVINGANRLITQ